MLILLTGACAQLSKERISWPGNLSEESSRKISTGLMGLVFLHGLRYLVCLESCVTAGGGRTSPPPPPPSSWEEGTEISIMFYRARAAIAGRSDVSNH